MEYLLVVFLLMNGTWVRGDTIEGWGSVRYESEQRCLESKARAERIQADLKRHNPRAYDKRFACEMAPPKVKK
ncbi:MAG: hypothetical protein QF893_15640 [Alphaproteobacteria bacterium]|jgi:hypothetical protein|nr:hypothetical protein [Alphaproteobacteria bacterium]